MQQQPLPPGAPTFTAPSFYLTGRQPLRPGAILLAVGLAIGALSSVLYALDHNRQAHLTSGGSGEARSAEAAASSADDKDDPNQVDTVVLGDPGDAPVPARRGDHVSPVHPTLLVHLPRFGDRVGLIPDTVAGRLLYAWLAAFNQANATALGDALPNVARASTVATQMELRRQTGGYFLLSAQEVEPGVRVFRLRDQTRLASEVLGTLQARTAASPAAVASFSLRAVPSSRQHVGQSPVAAPAK